MTTTPAQLASDQLQTGQVTVGTTATLIVPARPYRNSVTVILKEAVACHVGPAGVTAANGAFLPGVIGASMTLPYSGAIYMVSTGATCNVSFMETF